MGFNWWEAVAGAAGGIGGAFLGALAGQPVAGAVAGYGIGTSISPGGYWNEDTDADAATLRQTESAGITAAAMKEMAAAEAGIRRQTGAGVQAVRNRFGQVGTFQSGARGRAEDQVRQGGTQALAEAFAGIKLESIRAHQAGAANALNADMLQAQMAWQKEQQESAMIAGLIEIALPFFLDDKTKGAGGLSLDPTQAFTQDQQLGMAGFQPMGQQEAMAARRRFFNADQYQDFSAYGGGQ